MLEILFQGQAPASMAEPWPQPFFLWKMNPKLKNRKKKQRIKMMIKVKPGP